jgi:hypothetical protein
MLICRCICCSFLYNCINIFHNVINIFCIYFVLTKCIWLVYFLSRDQKSCNFPDPHNKLPDEGPSKFIRNIEVYPCIFQVVASLPNKASNEDSSMFLLCTVCGIINTLSTLLGIFKLQCFVTKNICRLIVYNYGY